jgi:hypothetical protein
LRSPSSAARGSSQHSQWKASAKIGIADSDKLNRSDARTKADLESVDILISPSANNLRVTYIGPRRRQGQLACDGMQTKQWCLFRHCSSSERPGRQARHEGGQDERSYARRGGIPILRILVRAGETRRLWTASRKRNIKFDQLLTSPNSKTCAAVSCMTILK